MKDEHDQFQALDLAKVFSEDTEASEVAEMLIKAAEELGPEYVRWAKALQWSITSEGEETIFRDRDVANKHMERIIMGAVALSQENKEDNEETLLSELLTFVCGTSLVIGYGLARADMGVDDASR